MKHYLNSHKWIDCYDEPIKSCHFKILPFWSQLYAVQIYKFELSFQLFKTWMPTQVLRRVYS
jgi:hypothetical protein